MNSRSSTHLVLRRVALSLASLVAGALSMALLLVLMSPTPILSKNALPQQHTQAPALLTSTVSLPLVMNHDPTQPRMISPAPGAQVDTLIPLFQFYMGIQPPEMAGVLEYSTNPDPNRTGVNFTFGIGDNPFWELRAWQNLQPQSTYYWRIGLLQDYDYENVQWLEQITLTTPASGTILPAVVQQSPVSGSVVAVDNLVFQWLPVAGAVEYAIGVEDLDTDRRYATTLATHQLVAADAWFHHIFVTGHHYRWLVRVRNDYAWAEDSPWFYFVIAGNAQREPQSEIREGHSVFFAAEGGDAIELSPQ